MASPNNADPDDQLSLSLYWPISRRSSPAEFLEEEEADALEGAGNLEAMATARKKRTVASQRSLASAKSASRVSLVPQDSASRGAVIAGGKPNVGSWHGTPGADDSQELAGAVTSVATSPAVNRTLFDAFELFLRSQVHVCRCLCLRLLRLWRSVSVSVSVSVSESVSALVQCTSVDASSLCLRLFVSESLYAYEPRVLRDTGPVLEVPSQATVLEPFPANTCPY